MKVLSIIQGLIRKVQIENRTPTLILMNPEAWVQLVTEESEFQTGHIPNDDLKVTVFGIPIYRTMNVKDVFVVDDRSWAEQ